MKKYLVVIASGLLFATTAAMAAPQQHGDDSHHGQQYDNHHDDHRDNHRDDHHDNRQGDHHDNHYYVGHERARREGWYRKGGHVPVEYRDSRYVVTDWRGHHLHEPPRGYHWVRSDNNEYLLVAISTGIIASILMGQ